MYGKLFASMFTGSMYGAGADVFAVWSFALATARPPGVCELNTRQLAACIGTSRDAVQKAIEFLCAPDPESRNPDEEGRRLLHMSAFEYQVVSWEKYRDLREEEDRRVYQREWIANKRAEHRQESTSVDSRLAKSTPVRRKSTKLDGRQELTLSTKVEVEVEEEVKKEKDCTAPWICPDGIEPAAWSDWLKVRKRKKAENSDRAYASVMTKIEAIRKAGLNPTTFVDKSATNGWSDIYPPEPKPNGPTSSRQNFGDFGAFDTTGVDLRLPPPKG